jgi:hypothetical protein
MSNLDNLTFGDALRGLAKYRPYLLAVTGVFLIAVVLPGTRPDAGGDTVSTDANVAAGTTADTTPDDTTTDTASLDDAASPEEVSAAGAAGVAAGGAGASRPGGGAGAAPAGAATRTPVAPAPASAGGGDPLANPNCDPKTGRIKVPSLLAANCVPVFSGSNGGATYQGVSDKEIVVAIRVNPNPSPAGTAIVRAAGNDDTQEEVRQTRLEQIDFFQAHYETYGRKVKLVYFDMTGDPDDDAAARNDARKVAKEIKAFASWSGSGAYKDELVANGVMCITCTASEPTENYLRTAPFVFSTLMSSTQAYEHRAEYIGKRLCGRNAVHAGDAVYKTQARKLGLVYYETESNEYKSGIDFFEQELAKYNGCRLSDRQAYILELAKAQEDADLMIARAKQRGITSLIFAGDPLMPIFLTKAANNQNYNPEWIITGSALTDTAFFARTYDQVQWGRAFGVSMLSARGPKEVGDSWRLHVWHHGHGPPAGETYSVMWAAPWTFFTGVHLAGPNLNPGTFRDGLFSFKPVPSGITTIASSFGRHGIWPTDDYLQYDDMTEIWWDPTQPGKNEVGGDGVGMYRYVEGGKRYLPKAWPSTDVKAFDKAGTVIQYDTLPPGDQWPDYPHQKH